MIFFVVLTLPLLFTSFTIFPWQFGKTILFHIFIEVSLAGFLVHSLIKKGKEWKWHWNWLDLSILLFLGGLLITTLTGVNREQSFWMNQSRAIGVFSWIHFGVMYFLCRMNFSSAKEWKKVFQWSVGVAILVALSAIVQNYLPISWRGDMGERFSGILGNPAFFAAYMIPHAGISVWLFLQEKKIIRWFYACLAPFFIIMVWFSGIRGAFLGLIIGSAIAFVSVGIEAIRSRRENKKQVWKFVGISGFLFLILIGVGFVFQNSFLSSRLLDASLTTGSGRTRLMAWDIALRAFKDRPFFGFGWGNYEIPFNQHYNPQFLQYGFQETVWDKPHNAAFEMMASMGLFVIFYIGVFVAAAWALLRKNNGDSSEERVEKKILLATLVAYGVQNLFLFDTFSVLVVIIFLLAFIGQYAESKKEKIVHFTGWHPLLSVLVLALSGYCMLLNIQFLRSSHAVQSVVEANTTFQFSENVHSVFVSDTALKDENALLMAEHLTDLDKANLIGSANSSYWKAGALEVAQVLEEYARRYPQNIAYPNWAGQVYLVLGQYTNEAYYVQALENFKRSEQVAPNKQEIKFLLARAYLLQKDFANAILTAQQAVDIAPNVGQSYDFLGIAQVAGQKFPEAVKSFDLALKNGLSPLQEHRLYIIDIYTSQKEYDKAIEQYLILQENDPTVPDWYIKLAALYALKGDKDQALKMVDQALILAPEIKPQADAFIKQYNLR